MKVIVLLTKSVLIPLATMAFASAIDSAIQRTICGRDIVNVAKRNHFSHFE